MSTNELATQPTVAVEVSTPDVVTTLPHKADQELQNYHEQDESEYAIPDVKSGVRVDPDALMRIVMLHPQPPLPPCADVSNSQTPSLP
jgi:hypothetical protein